MSNALPVQPESAQTPWMAENARRAPGGGDYRQYRRIQANVLVRPVSFLAARARRVRDISLGGLRVFSDDEHRPGARLALELLLAQREAVEFLAEVVWIERLPEDAPARFDIGLKFVEVPTGVMQRIESVLATTDDS